MRFLFVFVNSTAPQPTPGACLLALRRASRGLASHGPRPPSVPLIDGMQKKSQFTTATGFDGVLLEKGTCTSCTNSTSKRSWSSAVLQQTNRS
jgi:hypothetical protein